MLTPHFAASQPWLVGTKPSCKQHVMITSRYTRHNSVPVNAIPTNNAIGPSLLARSMFDEFAHRIACGHVIHNMVCFFVRARLV